MLRYVEEKLLVPFHENFVYCLGNLEKALNF